MFSGELHVHFNVHIQCAMARICNTTSRHETSLTLSPPLLLRPLFGLWPQGGDVWHHGAPGNYRGMSHTERVAACTLKGYFSSDQETRKCLGLLCCPEQISWDNLRSLNQMLNPNSLLKSPFLVIVLRRALMFPAHVPVIDRYRTFRRMDCGLSVHFPISLFPTSCV